MTKLSNSLLLGANAKVSPLIKVSTGASVLTGIAGLVAAVKTCVCLTTKVKVKTSSSSFVNRTKKLGGAVGGASGSYQSQVSMAPL